MFSELTILMICIAIVLFYDLVNGFHDAANSIATIISTQVLRPYVAVLWAAFFNFIAMFNFLQKVADTLSKIIKVGFSDFFYMYIVLSRVLSTLFWGDFNMAIRTTN